MYSYSLKQGIEDGFLAEYKVVLIGLDKDLQGWRPPAGMSDDFGQAIEDRIYNLRDMDRSLILNQRTKLVAERVVAYLAGTDPYGKTIVFCEDIDHAERMRSALVPHREAAWILMEERLGRSRVRRPLRPGVHVCPDGAAGQGGEGAREVRRSAPGRDMIGNIRNRIGVRTS